MVNVFFTPGHSSDSVCLLIENALFSGDTIFSSGIGRTDLYDSDKNEMKKSLMKIKDIDFNICYPGHDEVTTKLQIDNIIECYF